MEDVSIRSRIESEVTRFELITKTNNAKTDAPGMLRYLVDHDCDSIPALMDRDIAIATAVFIEQATGKRAHVRACWVGIATSVPGCGIASGWVTDENPEDHENADAYAGEMPEDIASGLAPEVVTAADAFERGIQNLL